MIRSPSGRLTPRLACSPPILATISAVASVIGWIGTVAFSSSRNAPPPIAKLGRVGSIDSVADFCDGEGAENESDFAGGLPNRLEGLFRCEFPSLGGDQDAGIED